LSIIHNVFLICVFLIGPISSSDAEAKNSTQSSKFPRNQQTVSKVNNIDDEQDEFGSSAQQDTALGPKIKYPKTPFKTYSSSHRYFTGGQVNSLPFRSPAEALEIVPGLAVGH
jgi:hypothetical protein